MTFTLNRMFELLRDLDNSPLSSDAKDLLIHFMINQGEDWVHHESYILTKKNWYHRRFMEAKKELLEIGLITSDFVYTDRKRNGCKITVNYDWTFKTDTAPESCKVPICNVTNSNVTQSDFTEFSKVPICNVTPSNVTPSNVTRSDLLISKKIKIKEENTESSKKSENKEEKKKRKLKEKTENENATQTPFTADEYSEDYLTETENVPEVSVPVPVPEEDHTATFNELFGPDELMPVKKKKAPKLKFVPPSQEEIRNYISKTIKMKGLENYWTPEQIDNLAGQIWNYYESVNWRVGNKIMEKWHNAVSGWCYRQNWMPRNTGSSAGRQKTFKEIDQENRDRIFTHHEEYLIELAAKRIVSTNSTEVLNGMPECLRNDALKLAEKLRKEQGDKPKVRLLF